MFALTNSNLTVSILDPVADAGYLGSRYCTGGYIWQVNDHLHRPLLAGPQFPSAQPLPFHGQGVPEAFVTPLGSDDCAVGETVTVIGVGEVRRTSGNAPFHVRDNPTVERFCRWKVEPGPKVIRMSTDQRAPGYDIAVVRTVELDGRTVVSRTEVNNRSATPLPVRWFAHPFFPLNGDMQCCRLPFLWSIPDNPGYSRSADGTLSMREDYDWKKGLFQQLGIPAGTTFAAEIYHPKLRSVNVNADYPLESLPVWANDATFSLEPYLSGVIAPGTEFTWKIEYRFNQ